MKTLIRAHSDNLPGALARDERPPPHITGPQRPDSRRAAVNDVKASGD